MSRKNDFLFMDTTTYGYGSRHFVVIAGGRVRIPLWLLWATWGVIGGAVMVFETVMSFVNNTFKDGPPWQITGWLILATAAVFVLYWLWVGLVFFIEEWRDALTGRN